MTLIHEVSNYCDNILTDKILACKKHKWACMRFLNDLNNSEKGNFRYVFVEQNAERYLNFMRLFKHTKGPLAGTFKEPVDIEKFIFSNIYGWIDKETLYRRFRNAYYQVARKNAKSQDMAIMGLYELAPLGEPCSEVYVAATKRDQTRFVFNEADLIYNNCDELKTKFKTSYGIIKHKKSGSEFRRMSKDDKIRGDGSNPQCMILDEYHAHETDEYYNIAISGMKTRTQPLLFIITTAGFNLNHPCYRDEYRYVEKILDPDSPVENDRYFAMICELEKNEEGEIIDDILDEKVWIKANPIIANTFEGLESIRNDVKIAQDKPEKMRDLLTKTFNIWVNQKECGYMNMEKWKSCSCDFPDLTGSECFIGIDLSSKIDLSSVSVIVPHEENFYIFSHSFLPSKSLDEKSKTDRANYEIWIDQGHITTTNGAIVDYDVVCDYAITFTDSMGFYRKEWCFDPWGATNIMSKMESEGENVVEIRQGFKTLAVPTKTFREYVYSNRIKHQNNPVLNYAMNNAVCVTVDRNGNILLSKEHSYERIDPVAATINAFTEAIIEKEVPYANHGLRSLVD